MEVPGVEKKDIEINLENDVLRVEGRIDFGKYEGLEPLYTEYNVGNYFMQFELNEDVDDKHIGALMRNGVLELTLPKGERAQARRIEVRTG